MSREDLPGRVPAVQMNGQPDQASLMEPLKQQSSILGLGGGSYDARLTLTILWVS